MRAAFDALGAWGAAAGMAEVTSNADESHVPEPYCFRAVFISDLHLGTPVGPRPGHRRSRPRRLIPQPDRARPWN